MQEWNVMHNNRAEITNARLNMYATKVSCHLLQNGVCVNEWKIRSHRIPGLCFNRTLVVGSC
jgi:hypothetical protein